MQGSHSDSVCLETRVIKQTAMQGNAAVLGRANFVLHMQKTPLRHVLSPCLFRNRGIIKLSDDRRACVSSKRKTGSYLAPSSHI